MANVSSVTVFCGSSFGDDDRFRTAAAELGRRLAERHITLVYGGGGVGLMGVLANSALDAGGRVVGIIPRFLKRAEKGVEALAELQVVDSMHERKERMFALSDAFIVLPGGYGTLDETFEILTWKQLGLHDKPLILIDIAGYWQSFHRVIEHILAAGFARPDTRDLFRIVPNVEMALTALAEARAPLVEPAAPERL